MLLSTNISVGARASLLSQAQVKEVIELFPSIVFHLILIDTSGDKDQIRSLKTLEKSDFFTKEIDQMLLKGECRIAIHSAKDLPEPLPEGLKMIALTEGVDNGDALLFNRPLPDGALIGTSCERREQAVKAYRSDLRCIDIRGTIEKRLKLLDSNQIDGLVVAEAALIRLNLLSRNRIRLKGETAPLQGKLAILARVDDQEMEALFRPLDIRKKKVLYLGLDPAHYQGWGEITHLPQIKVVSRKMRLESIEPFTHIIFTSKSAVRFFLEQFPSIDGKVVIAIGKITALHLQKKAIFPNYISQEETQEGIISLLNQLDLKAAYLLLPRSTRARPLLVNALKKRGIRYRAIDLYETVPTQLPLPDLNQFDEIVFTSPSTVEAFFAASPALLKKIKMRPIGPVTSNRLRDMLN